MGETKVSYVRPSLFLIYTVTSTLLGSISLGLTVGFTSSAIPSMESNWTQPRIIEHDHEETKSWIKSIISIGAMVGALIAGPIANLIGRKLALIAANVPFFFGWMSIAFASGVTPIMIGRVVTGFCSGFVCTVIPLYLVEISTLNLRGLIGSTFQVAICGGILISSILGVFLEWRHLALASSFPCLLMPLLMFFTTESPAYLINQQSTCNTNNNNDNDNMNGNGNGNNKETYKVLQRLRSDSSNIQGELNELGSTVDRNPQTSFSWQLVKRPEFYRPFLIAFGIMFFQQFTGITPVLLSMVEIFRLSHITLDSFICSVIVNSVSFVSTIVSSLLADRCGRKPLLMISGVLIVISLTTLGSAFYIIGSDTSLGAKYGFIALIASMVFVAGYALGYCSLPFLMLSEYTIYEARGVINSVGTCFSWTFAFIMVKSFEDMQHHLKPYGTFWLLAIITLISIPFVALFVPETKGKSADQVAEQFGKKLFLDVPCMG